MRFSLDVIRARKGDCLMVHYGTTAQPRLMMIDGGPSNVYKPICADASRRSAPLAASTTTARCLSTSSWSVTWTMTTSKACSTDEGAAHQKADNQPQLVRVRYALAQLLRRPAGHDAGGAEGASELRRRSGERRDRTWTRTPTISTWPKCSPASRRDGRCATMPRSCEMLNSWEVNQQFGGKLILRNGDSPLHSLSMAA